MASNHPLTKQFETVVCNFLPLLLLLLVLPIDITPVVGQMQCGPRISPRLLMEIPCDMTKMSFCNQPGSAYPWSSVRRYIYENQGFMRRMYGDQRHSQVLRSEIDEIREKYDSIYMYERGRAQTPDPDFFGPTRTVPDLSSSGGGGTHSTSSSPTITTSSSTTSLSSNSSTDNIMPNLYNNTIDSMYSNNNNNNSAESGNTTIPESEVRSTPDKLFADYDINGGDATVVEMDSTSYGDILSSSPTTTTITTAEDDDDNNAGDDSNIDDNNREPNDIVPNGVAVDQSYANSVTTPHTTATTSESSDNDSEAATEPPRKGVNACPIKEEVIAPYWANNTRGETLALLNVYPFEQYIHWEKCAYEGSQMFCRDGCRCEQQYRLHRLLAFDPKNECRGIFADWFRFPGCCVCICYDLSDTLRVNRRKARL
ncbi:protein spaetzle 4-like [Oppia nitens]|uniref:protein spaetzle 4-like n=1 Tax=Oppia nitens TaxID=1686743 RepID=UPI0023DBF6F3|nr:protein spaetzle 4-like [Oppia nitens]